MTISLANTLLAASALLMPISIFLQLRLNRRQPEQRALLAQSNPTPMLMKGKISFLIIGALILTPYPYKFMAFAVLLLATSISYVAQYRALRRLEAHPGFINRWIATSALFLLGGAAFTGALYLGALRT